MVTYKAVNADSLDADLTTVANAIRSKTGKNEDLEFPEGFVSEVESIPAVSVSENPQTDDLQSIHVVFSKATSIGDTKFRYYGGIKSLGFPKVKSIGYAAFSGCSALANIDIPVVETIGGYAFFGTALTKVDLPAVTSIGESAFQNCGSLETVIIRSASVPSLGKDAFKGTPIETGDGLIYVQDDYFEQCTTAANWSTYASKINKLSDYKGN